MEKEEKELNDNHMLRHKKNRDKTDKDDNDYLNESSKKEHAKYKKSTKHPNRKKALYKQLDFYFCDANLVNDKYLRHLLSVESNGIDVSIILGFNKIKEMLYDIDSTEAKINMIKLACDMSKDIYFAKNKIQRYKKFNLNNIDQNHIDECTIYIENLPPTTTHDVLSKVFSLWKVNYISIPKYKTKECKGFAFVSFDNKKDANEAMMFWQNKVPEQLTNLLPNKLSPLKIITKKEWIENKERFKELKIELQKTFRTKFVSCMNGKITSEEGENSLDQLNKGTLVKISYISNSVTIQDIKIVTSNIIEPIYIDYNKDNHYAILRFANRMFSDSFIKKIEEEAIYLKGVKITSELIKGKEEEDYLAKIKELKEEYQKKKIEKKGKDN